MASHEARAKALGDVGMEGKGPFPTLHLSRSEKRAVANPAARAQVGRAVEVRRVCEGRLEVGDRALSRWRGRGLDLVDFWARWWPV